MIATVVSIAGYLHFKRKDRSLSIPKPPDTPFESRPEIDIASADISGSILANCYLPTNGEFSVRDTKGTSLHYPHFLSLALAQLGLDNVQAKHNTSGTKAWHLRWQSNSDLHN